jgi:hypothetical protein
LVDSTGEQVELSRWQEALIPANGAGAVVVGIEGERAQLGCPCTLKLWEAGAAHRHPWERHVPRGPAGGALSTAAASRAEPQGMERPPISGKRS